MPFCNILTHRVHLCCPHTHRCGALHWSTVHSPQATLLNKTHSSSPWSHRLSVTLSHRWGVMSPSTLCARTWTGSILSKTFTGDHICCKLMSVMAMSCPVLPKLWILKSLQTVFHNGPWTMVGASDRNVPFVAKQSAHSFLTLCSIMCFSVNHYPLHIHKKASLITSESWVLTLRPRNKNLGASLRYNNSMFTVGAFKLPNHGF